MQKIVMSQLNSKMLVSVFLFFFIAITYAASINQIKQENDLVQSPLITFNSINNLENQMLEKRGVTLDILSSKENEEAETGTNNDKETTTNEKNAQKTESVKNGHDQNSTKSSVTTPVSSDTKQDDHTTKTTSHGGAKQTITTVKNNHSSASDLETSARAASTVHSTISAEISHSLKSIHGKTSPESPRPIATHHSSTKTSTGSVHRVMLPTSSSSSGTLTHTHSTASKALSKSESTHNVDTSLRMSATHPGSNTKSSSTSKISSSTDLVSVLETIINRLLPTHSTSSKTFDETLAEPTSSEISLPNTASTTSVDMFASAKHTLMITAPTPTGYHSESNRQKSISLQHSSIVSTDNERTAMTIESLTIKIGTPVPTDNASTKHTRLSSITKDHTISSTSTTSAAPTTTITTSATTTTEPTQTTATEIYSDDAVSDIPKSTYRYETLAWLSEPFMYYSSTTTTTTTTATTTTTTTNTPTTTTTKTTTGTITATNITTNTVTSTQEEPTLTTASTQTASFLTDDDTTSASSSQAKDEEDTTTTESGSTASSTATSSTTNSSTIASSTSESSTTTSSTSESSTITSSTLESSSATSSKSESSTATSSTTATADDPFSSSTENNLPQYITPNLNAIIPDSSQVTFIKFNSISYAKLVSDALLTAQMVQEIPLMLGDALDTSADNVIVVSIQKSAATVNKKRSDASNNDNNNNDNNGVMVSVAIPKTEVNELQALITNSSSPLYDSKNGQLPTYIDRSYPITAKAIINSGGGPGALADPNGDTDHAEQSSKGNANDSQGGLPKGGIIGICVGVSVCVYAAATVIGVHIYRKRRQKRAQQTLEQHRLFAKSISSPIMQGNSLGFMPGPYQHYRMPSNVNY
ncbi:hypothetical protein BD408DRAFT_480621 [Parasitella parasitica]|nr:hypothetical protein BD408DRAFT_480621 [Parasitella parasitica]